MAATLSLGNIAYLHLSVSMIQILKSLCPVITVRRRARSSECERACTPSGRAAHLTHRAPPPRSRSPLQKLIILHLSGIETPSRAVVLAVLVISVGCAIAVEGDIEFSWLGFWIVIASEVCECSRVVCVQWLIEGKKLKKGQKDGASAPTTSAAVSGTDPALGLNALSSLYFLAPACVLWVAVLVVTTGEGAACGRERCWEKVLARYVSVRRVGVFGWSSLGPLDACIRPPSRLLTRFVYCTSLAHALACSPTNTPRARAQRWLACRPTSRRTRRPGLYLLAASLGFGVNLTTFLVIQTSPSGSLTFKAAGTRAAPRPRPRAVAPMRESVQELAATHATT